MRDDVSRELERAKDESPDARAAWLRSLADAERVRPSHLAALAACGDPGAVLLAPPRKENLVTFLADVASSSGVKAFFVAFAAMILDLHGTFGVKPNELTLSSLEDWFDLIGTSPAEGADGLTERATKVVGAFARSLSPLLLEVRPPETSPSGLTAALLKANPDSLLAAAKKAVTEWALSGGEVVPPLAWLWEEHEAGRLDPEVTQPVSVPMAPVAPDMQDYVIPSVHDHAIPDAVPDVEQAGLHPLPPIMPTSELQQQVVAEIRQRLAEFEGRHAGPLAAQRVLAELADEQPSRAAILDAIRILNAADDDGEEPVGKEGATP